MSESKSRYCTMPKIPFFRDWYEEKFGDLCKAHDEAYGKGKCKLCADYKMSREITSRGYVMMGILTFLAVNLPWVWLSFIRQKDAS